MKYYLRGYIHDNSLSLEKFIYKFLTKFNEQYPTVDEHDHIICYTGKYRSLGDITAICNGYYETSKDEVKEVLLDFGNDLVGHYCSTIDKRVYVHKNLHPNWDQCSAKRKDEYGDSIVYRTENKNLEYYD